MANSKIMLQAADFLTKMNIPYTSIKMFGKMLMINTTDIESARVIESILNGSGAANVSVDEDRYQNDYAIVGLIQEEIGKQLDLEEEDEL